RKRHIEARLRETNRHAGNQRNALVRRAKQHVTGHAGGADRTGIETAQFTEGLTVVEQPGIEKIRRLAPGLGNEGAKTQHALVAGKFDEIAARIHVPVTSRQITDAWYASSRPTSTASAPPPARAFSNGSPGKTRISSACKSSRPRPTT